MGGEATFRRGGANTVNSGSPHLLFNARLVPPPEIRARVGRPLIACRHGRLRVAFRYRHARQWLLTPLPNANLSGKVSALRR